MDLINFYRWRRAYRRERLLRDRLNPLEFYDNVEIKEYFRFERENILIIAGELHGALQHVTGRGKSLAPIQQLCVALRFFATGCMQLSLGGWINIDQSTVSRAVWTVTLAILDRYPDSFQINDTCKHGFFEKFGIPNIIGCVDGTHIEIKRPANRNFPDEYVNRKMKTTINVQVTVDSDLRFTDVDASWPGSVHDSRIFKNSVIYNELVTGRLPGILIADKGYGLTLFCLTPFRNPVTERERNFNRIHKTTRCTVERAIGVLKKRFYSMKSILRIKLDRVPCVIVACCILHNKARELHDPDFEIDDDDLDLDDDDDDSDEPDNLLGRNDNYLRRRGEIKRAEMTMLL